jgi:hypothetical protein
MESIPKTAIKINGYSLQTIEYYANICLAQSIDNYFKKHHNGVLEYAAYVELKKLVIADAKKQAHIEDENDANKY